jgi:hypothetical protein
MLKVMLFDNSDKHLGLDFGWPAKFNRWRDDNKGMDFAVFCHL